MFSQDVKSLFLLLRAKVSISHARAPLQRNSRFEAPPDVKGEHSPVHIFLEYSASYIMRRMRCKARIVNPRNHIVAPFKVLCMFHRVLARFFHPDLPCCQTSLSKPAIERCSYRASPRQEF